MKIAAARGQQHEEFKMSSYENIITRFNGYPTIDQFIEERNFNINRDTFNRFWYNLDKKIHILIDNELIELIGYSS